MAKNKINKIKHQGLNCILINMLRIYLTTSNPFFIHSDSIISWSLIIFHFYIIPESTKSNEIMLSLKKKEEECTKSNEVCRVYIYIKFVIVGRAFFIFKY